MIPAFFIIVLRGNVGTDTAVYLQMVLDILSGMEVDTEYGFVLVVKFFDFLGFNSHFIVNFISGFVVIYSVFIFSSSREKFCVFVMLIFPYFLYDMSMNGIRYGVSFLLAFHAAIAYKNKDIVFTCFLIVLSIAMQMSGILVFVLLLLPSFRKRDVFIITIFISISVTFFY
ncbi:hypothetical protein GKO28_03365 [Deefgea sp. CFH1-16]|nr:hypothetical protein [Deefgea sp. CFH1-16]